MTQTYFVGAKVNAFLAITNLPTCGSTGVAVMLQEQGEQEKITILTGAAYNQKRKKKPLQQC